MIRMRFKLNRKGVRELLRSQEMEGICKEYAERALERLGDGYEADTHVGPNRVNAMVSASTYKARRENSKDKTILKAVR